jgi:CheY-like chemotaxis protein
MGVLIVDFNYERRQSLFEIIKWADRRLQVKFAADGAAALQIGATWRPHLVFCSLQLPDVSASHLYSRIRERLSRSLLVGYGDQALLERQSTGVFHALLETPLHRLAVVPLITAARKARFGLAAQPRTVRHRRGRHKSNDSIRVELCTCGDNLVFTFEIPSHSTLAGVLNRLGRRDFLYRLTRDGNEYPATPETLMQNGDRLLFTEQPDEVSPKK